MFPSGCEARSYCTREYDAGFCLIKVIGVSVKKIGVAGILFFAKSE